VSLLLLIGAATARAQHATSESATRVTVTGRVFNTKTQEGVAYAPVAVTRLSAPDDSVGTPAGGVTASETGEYTLSLEPGLYALRVTYFSYRTFIAHAVTVAGATVRVDFPLVEEAVTLADIDVLGSRITKTQVVLEEQRKSAAVSDGVSSDQLKKGTDSNAAEAITRVTGLSVVGGKYAFVRGLGERYSQTQVNGVTIGSPEPNKRVIPLDLFATGLLDKIVVQKTYTPDKPGDFAGGVVDIATIDFPGARTWNLSMSTGHNSRTTDKGFLAYSGGDRDWLGLDDGARELPAVVRQLAGHKRIRSQGPSGGGFTEEELAVMGKAFSKTLTPKRTVAGPAIGASGSYGDKFSLLGRDFGFYVSSAYSNSANRNEHNARTVFATSEAEGGEEVLDLKTDYLVDKSEQKVLWGAVGSANYGVGTRSTLRLRTMYNRSAEDEVRVYEGYSEDIGGDLRTTRLRYIERGVLSSTAEFDHPLPFLRGSSVLWRYGRSEAERNEPDRREHTYEYRPTTDDWVLSIRDANLTRIFGATQDDEWTGEARVEIPLWGGPRERSNGGTRADRTDEAFLKTGYFHRDKERQTDFRVFQYLIPTRSGYNLTLPVDSLFTDETIGGNRRTFLLQEATRDEDSYRGTHDLEASFVMADLPLTKHLRLIGGVRWERSRQFVDTNSPFRADSTLSGVQASLNNKDALPSANLVYQLTARMNVRAAYSRTVSRPDLRELSPMISRDFRSGLSESGNPNLQRSRIANYDLRWEWYPGPTELFAVSGFYKDFEKPIETAIQGGAQQLYTPFNGEEGRLHGAELEARFGLGRIVGALDFVGLSTNLTFVESATSTVDSTVASIQRERPLWGQSPYVANVGLYLASPGEGTTATILYNVAGKRLAYVGSFGLPDIYERPRHSLDLKFSLGKGLIKVAFENVLDSEQQFKQGDFVTDRQRSGRTASISIGVKS
jgi:outer membrane receptor protein involved in Fe transport